MAKVLVIEDVPHFLHWTMQTLREHFPGLTLEKASSEREARTHLRQSAPDLVVLDLGLPRNRPGEPALPRVGLALLQSIKNAAAPPPVVVLTSYDLREPSLTSGADAFVSKSSPTVWKELVAEVGRLLRVN